jgi:hypothetical protein
MEHQPTQGGGRRVPLGVDHLQEGAMSVVVGIDVGTYKHAAAVCRAGEREAEKRVLRYEPTRRGFRSSTLGLSSRASGEGMAGVLGIMVSKPAGCSVRAPSKSDAER